jgi:hypothetical protein
MAKGGARPGAGRPKGTFNKPQLRDFISEDEVHALVEQAKAQAIDKPELLKFILDHVFGKARQNIGLDGGEDGVPLSIEISEQIAQKNGLHDPHTSTKSDS